MVRKILLNILPKSVINLYKTIKKNVRLKQRNQLLKDNIIITESDIIAVLIKNGIIIGDTIMLHSSLSKIGYVQNGADAVIDAILNVIGSDGTLMMPSFPATGYNYDYLKTNPIFDSNHTPSKMGIITETFRKRNNVLRSLHPTDSVSALGKQATYLVIDHFNQLTPYNNLSPFYKLCQLKGKIVMLGVSLDSLTNLHTLEDAVEEFKFPVYHQTQFKALLIDNFGNAVTMQTKVHNPYYSKQRNCNALLPHFKDAGFLKQFKLGNADCIIIEADKMHTWMVENYNTKGITMYTPNGTIN